jgi:ferric-dicitrate binding protein FerR (iron transport regulator)
MQEIEKQSLPLPLPEHLRLRSAEAFRKMEIPWQKEEAVVVAMHRGSGRLKWMKWAVAAACLILVVAGGWWWQKVSRSSSPENIAWQTIRNDSAGSHFKVVHLADGTTVTLNAHSEIRYSSVYNGKTREIELKGEAFFDVARDVGRPFIVHAGKASTQVYGTAFNISAYPDASQLRIALQHGKIGVRYDGVAGTERILSPGELLICDKADDSFTLEKQPAADMNAWTTGKISFYKTPLSEVFRDLGSRYGKHFDYDIAVGKRAITGSYNDASLQQVIQYLHFLTGLRFTQSKDHVYIRE